MEGTSMRWKTDFTGEQETELSEKQESRRAIQSGEGVVLVETPVHSRTVMMQKMGCPRPGFQAAGSIQGSSQVHGDVGAFWAQVIAKGFQFNSADFAWMNA